MLLPSFLRVSFSFCFLAKDSSFTFLYFEFMSIILASCALFVAAVVSSCKSKPSTEFLSSLSSLSLSTWVPAWLIHFRGSVFVVLMFWFWLAAGTGAEMATNHINKPETVFKTSEQWHDIRRPSVVVCVELSRCDQDLNQMQLLCVSEAGATGLLQFWAPSTTNRERQTHVLCPHNNVWPSQLRPFETVKSETEHFWALLTVEENPKGKTNSHWLQSLPLVMSHYDNDYEDSTHNREIMVKPSRYSTVNAVKMTREKT